MRVRFGPLCRAFVAFVAIGALMGGVPYVLVRFVGWPLPRSVPSAHAVLHALGQHGISNTALIDILAVALWIAWAVLALAFVVEGLALMASREPSRVRVAGYLQPIAGALLGALVLSLAASFARSGTSGAAMPRAAVIVPIRPPEANVAQPITAQLTDVHLDGSVPRATGEPISRTANTRTYVVNADDTLWGIAAAELGDASHWQEIFDLNRGVLQAGGGALENPHWIYPGWVLKLPPAVASGPVSKTAPSQRVDRAPDATAKPTPTTTPTTSTPTTPTTSVPSTTPSATPSVATEPTAPAAGPIGPAPAPASTNGVRTHHEDASNHHVAPRKTTDVSPVHLPSGSVVGGAFALGVLGALALARKRRRHAYRYRPPLPGRRLTAEPLGPALQALVEQVQAPSDDPERIVPTIAVVPADDDADHRERPDFIEIGTRDDGVVSAMLSELAGVSFVGNNADWVVRQLLCEMFVRSGPLAAEVCTTEDAIARLFPGIGASVPNGDVPGVRRLASGEAVCSMLEGEIAARTQRFAIDEAPDVVSYRRTFSWDPMPTVIALIEEIDGALAERWQTIIELGPRLGLGVIILDARGGRRVELTGWQATTNDPTLAVIDGVECFGIGPYEAGEILRLHVEVEERPSSDDEEPAPRLVVVDEPVDDAEDGEEPWPEPSSAPPLSEADDDVPERDEVTPSSAPAIATAPITVRVFGPYEIAVNGHVVGTGLRMVARELLAWHLLRPEGASIGAAVEALWPDTDPAGVSNKFWRAASDLRTEIGAAATPSSKLVKQSGDVYQLDAAAIDCDLWRFQAVLRTAARADDAQVARRALREAVDCYGGEFLDGMEWFWVAPVREDLHRRALDADLRLAELEDQLGNPAAAEAVLDAAIEFDRYAEEPYRRLMTLQAEHGRLDAVTATWRALERRLAEIDVDPEPTTLRCYRSLTAPPTQSRVGDDSVRRLRRTP